MIGRQSLYLASAQLRAICASYGDQLGEAEAAEICEGGGGFSEALLRHLGAAEASSFDYSDYEKPTYTHDMNKPIGEQFKARFNVVLDGGSLEHIFDFPTAIRNCMEMVELGGHYLAITPANNFVGHGFYQFSPELYFTVLSPENGFEMVSMIAIEERENPVWYQVANPREVGGRVTLANKHPVHLLIVAKREKLVPIFAQTPQQSDYTVIWGEREAQRAAAEPALLRPLPTRLAKLLLPFRLRQGLRGLAKHLPRRKPPAFDPHFFRPMP